MEISKKTNKIIECIYNNEQLDKSDFLYLLNLKDLSLESEYIKANANILTRQKNDNGALILGQIPIETGPCDGNCKFCSFGENHTSFKNNIIDEDLFTKKVKEFSNDGDLYGLYLMTMNTYDIDNYINYIKLAKKIVPSSTRIFSNVGDTDVNIFKEFKKAGISGVYHVKRIDEGKNTKIKPETRIQTIKNAQEAGLDTFTCLEPIAPENTNEQLVEDMFIGIDLKCKQHAVMRRVPVPLTPFENTPYISNYRLSHILSVLTLAVLNYNKENNIYIGVHEPNLLGYISGANVITAESGKNPRDISNETLNSRGFDLMKSRTMLYESGFEYLINGNEKRIKLDYNYIDSLKI